MSTVTRLDAGTYQCRAGNGVGQPQFKKVDLLITCKLLSVLQKNRLIWVNIVKESDALNLLILFATGKSFDDVGPVLMEYDGRGETVAMLLTIHQTPSSYNIKRISLKYAKEKMKIK